MSIRKYPATFFKDETAEITDITDTTRFEKSYKKIGDDERLNPFFVTTIPTAKDGTAKTTRNSVRDFKRLL